MPNDSKSDNVSNVSTILSGGNKKNPFNLKVPILAVGKSLAPVKLPTNNDSVAALLPDPLELKDAAKIDQQLAEEAPDLRDELTIITELTEIMKRAIMKFGYSKKPNESYIIVIRDHEIKKAYQVKISYNKESESENKLTLKATDGKYILVKSADHEPILMSKDDVGDHDNLLGAKEEDIYIFDTLFKPLRNKVLFQVLPQKYAGSIILLDTDETKNINNPRSIAMIIATGEGSISDLGIFKPVSVKPGDKVIVGHYTGSLIRIDGQFYKITTDEEIDGVLEYTD